MPDLTTSPDDQPGPRSRRPNGAEQAVGRALKAQLLPGEVLLEGVRFSDPRHGDVEVDFLVLFPDAGVAVIEVKGEDEFAGIATKLFGWFVSNAYGIREITLGSTPRMRPDGSCISVSILGMYPISSDWLGHHQCR